MWPPQLQLLPALRGASVGVGAAGSSGGTSCLSPGTPTPPPLLQAPFPGPPGVWIWRTDRGRLCYTPPRSTLCRPAGGPGEQWRGPRQARTRLAPRPRKCPVRGSRGYWLRSRETGGRRGTRSQAKPPGEKALRLAPSVATWARRQKIRAQRRNGGQRDSELAPRGTASGAADAHCASPSSSGTRRARGRGGPFARPVPHANPHFRLRDRQHHPQAYKGDISSGRCEFRGLHFELSPHDLVARSARPGKLKA